LEVTLVKHGGVGHRICGKNGVYGKMMAGRQK
jgi:hypothetical protein